MDDLNWTGAVFDAVVARAEAAEAEAEAAQNEYVHMSDALNGIAQEERARAEAAEAEVERLRVALGLIDEARAKAVAETEELHRYLDECFINDPDEGCAVPLIDRVVLLVSQIARDNAEVERIRVALGGYRDSDLASLAETLRKRCDALEAGEAEAEQLRAAMANIQDWLPLSFESGAVYDKVRVMIGDALKDANTSQDAP